MNWNVCINAIHTSPGSKRWLREDFTIRGSSSETVLQSGIISLPSTSKGKLVSRAEWPFGSSLATDWPEPPTKSQPCKLSLVFGFCYMGKIWDRRFPAKWKQNKISSWILFKQKEEILPQENKRPSLSLIRLVRNMLSGSSCDWNFQTSGALTHVSTHQVKKGVSYFEANCRWFCTCW